MYIYAHIVIFHLTFQRLPYCWLLNWASLKWRSAAMWSIGHILLRHVFGLIGKMFSFSECVVCWNKIRLAFKLYKLFFASEVTLLITTVPCPAGLQMAFWISCNSCFLSPANDRKLALTSCGHVICNVCYGKGHSSTNSNWGLCRIKYSAVYSLTIHWSASTGGREDKSIDPTATSAGL